MHVQVTIRQDETVQVVVNANSEEEELALIWKLGEFKKILQQHGLVLEDNHGRYPGEAIRTSYGT